MTATKLKYNWKYKIRCEQFKHNEN